MWNEVNRLKIDKNTNKDGSKQIAGKMDSIYYEGKQIFGKHALTSQDETLWAIAAKNSAL